MRVTLLNGQNTKMKLNLNLKINLPILYDKASRAERRAVRIEYTKQQKGLCYYCKEPLNKEPKSKPKLNRKSFPRNFFKYKIHLHHCHKTGFTIGAVHAYCNAVLWQYHGE